MRSTLATARTHDPSTYIRDLPTNDVKNAAKVIISFAQTMAATPLVLVVRHATNLRSFLGGLDMINISIPKVRKIGITSFAVVKDCHLAFEPT